MLGPGCGWGLCRLPRGAVRGSACAALRAHQARLWGSGGAERPGSPSDVPPPGSAHRALKEWTLRVSPFGRLRTHLPCHLVVKPLDPLAFPDGDRVQVAVGGAGRGQSGLDRLRVEYDGNLQEMAILSDDIDPQALVEVNAPLKFGK